MCTINMTQKLILVIFLYLKSNTSHVIIIFKNVKLKFILKTYLIKLIKKLKKYFKISETKQNESELQCAHRRIAKQWMTLDA